MKPQCQIPLNGLVRSTWHMQPIHGGHSTVQMQTHPCNAGSHVSQQAEYCAVIGVHGQGTPTCPTFYSSAFTAPACGSRYPRSRTGCRRICLHPCNSISKHAPWLQQYISRCKQAVVCLGSASISAQGYVHVHVFPCFYSMCYSVTSNLVLQEQRSGIQPGCRKSGVLQCHCKSRLLFQSENSSGRLLLL